MSVNTLKQAKQVSLIKWLDILLELETLQAAMSTTCGYCQLSNLSGLAGCRGCEPEARKLCSETVTGDYDEEKRAATSKAIKDLIPIISIEDLTQVLIKKVEKLIESIKELPQ